MIPLYWVTSSPSSERHPKAEDAARSQKWGQGTLCWSPSLWSSACQSHTPTLICIWYSRLAFHENISKVLHLSAHCLIILRNGTSKTLSDNGYAIFVITLWIILLSLHYGPNSASIWHWNTKRWFVLLMDLCCFYISINKTRFRLYQNFLRNIFILIEKRAHFLVKKAQKWNHGYRSCLVCQIM